MLVVAGVVLMARRVAATDMVARPFRRLFVVTGVAAVALMTGHVIEVAVWAIVYALVGVAPGANPVYFAFVNYTTLGYGDVVPAGRVAIDRADHGHERHAAVRIVDGGAVRSAAHGRPEPAAAAFESELTPQRACRKWT